MRRTTSSACRRRPGSRCPRAPPTCSAASSHYPRVTDDGTYFLRPGDLHLVDRGVRRRRQPRHRARPSTFTITEPDVVGGRGSRSTAGPLDAPRPGAPRSSSNGGALCDNVPATPVLDWAPVTGAGGYLVYLAEDPDFTNRVLDPYAITINSRWTPTDAGADRPGRQPVGARPYYWFVRPCVERPPDRQLRTGPDRRRPTPRPTPSGRCHPRSCRRAPADNAIETGTEVTFSWQDYRTTNAGGHLRRRGLAVAPVRAALPAPGVPVRDDHRRQRHRRRHRRPDDVHGVRRHLPRGRPVVAGPGHRRRRQPAGLVGHPQVRRRRHRPRFSTRPTGPSTRGAYPALNGHVTSR